MTKIEMLLIARLLQAAEEVFSNHGCNDLPEEFWDGVSHAERQEIVKEWHEYNGDPESYNPDQIEYIKDWMLMEHFADKILQEKSTQNLPEIYDFYGKKYRKLNRDEIIKEGDLHYFYDSFDPVLVKYLMGNMPSSFSDEHEFYREIKL